MRDLLIFPPPSPHPAQALGSRGSSEVPTAAGRGSRVAAGQLLGSNRTCICSPRALQKVPKALSLPAVPPDPGAPDSLEAARPTSQLTRSPGRGRLRTDSGPPRSRRPPRPGPRPGEPAGPPARLGVPRGLLGPRGGLPGRGGPALLCSARRASGAETLQIPVAVGENVMSLGFSLRLSSFRLKR